MELSNELKIGVKSHSSSIDEPSADRVRRLADSKGLKREPEPEPEPTPAPEPEPQRVVAEVAPAAPAPAPVAADAAPAAPAPAPTEPVADAPITTPEQQVAAAPPAPPTAAEPLDRPTPQLVERSKSAVRSTGGIPAPQPI